MSKLSVAAALGTAVLAGPAFAQAVVPAASLANAQDPAPAARTPPPAEARRGGRGMMRADANHDGVVTRDEAIADADRRFDRLDGNRDGKVDAAEMQASNDAMQARREAAGQTTPVPPPGGARHAPGMGAHADPDGDGVITREEWRARATQRFDRFDANRDGKLDAGELPQPRFERQGTTVPQPGRVPPTADDQ